MSLLLFIFGGSRHGLLIDSSIWINLDLPILQSSMASFGNTDGKQRRRRISSQIRARECRHAFLPIGGFWRGLLQLSFTAVLLVLLDYNYSAQPAILHFSAKGAHLPASVAKARFATHHCQNARAHLEVLLLCRFFFLFLEAQGMGYLLIHPFG